MMLITVTAIWGAGLALYLTHRSMLCLGRLGTRLLQPRRPPRPRRLVRKMNHNQLVRRLRLLQPQDRQNPLPRNGYRTSLKASLYGRRLW